MPGDARRAQGGELPRRRPDRRVGEADPPGLSGEKRSAGLELMSDGPDREMGGLDRVE